MSVDQQKLMEVILDQVLDGILHFQSIAADKHDILIWMPEYIQVQFGEYISLSGHVQTRETSIDHGMYIHGFEVLQGYEDSVVVSVKDGSLHKIEPIKIRLG